MCINLNFSSTFLFSKSMPVDMHVNALGKSLDLGSQITWAQTPVSVNVSRQIISSFFGGKKKVPPLKTKVEATGIVIPPFQG